MDRIILVDDAKGALEEMAEELQEQGWEVDSFDNPQDALRALQNKSYALGILDIKMPGMSGVELLQRVKALQRDMDVIFITAFPELDTAIDAVQLGALDYLKRPFELRELVQAVKRSLTYRALRLDNSTLENKLETLYTIASDVHVSQTLSDVLNISLTHLASTISPDYAYIAFMECEGLEPVLATHGLDANRMAFLKTQLAALKRWLDIAARESLRIADISKDQTFPLHLGEIKALLLAPIFHKQVLTGALLCCAPQEEVFSLHDERFVVTTAHLVSHVVDRLKAEEQKRQHYQRMAEYLRAVAGGAAHDLKNPLTIISGSAQKALKSLGEQHPLFEDLKVIQEQALRADERMNELLDFCYRTDLWVQETVDLNRLVEETKIAMRHTDLPAGVELVAECIAEPLPVTGDSLQIKRALRNIIDNAIRATSGRGMVTMTTWSANGNAYIRVHNIGAPIPAERWEDIFKPQITSKAITGHYQRSGYGLPVARGILMSHRGYVEVEASTQEQGTTFLITIPMATDQEQE